MISSSLFLRCLNRRANRVHIQSNLHDSINIYTLSLNIWLLLSGYLFLVPHSSLHKLKSAVVRTQPRAETENRIPQPL